MGFKMFGKRLLSAALTLSMVAGMMVTGSSALTVGETVVGDWEELKSSGGEYAYVLVDEDTLDRDGRYMIVSRNTAGEATVVSMTQYNNNNYYYISTATETVVQDGERIYIAADGVDNNAVWSGNFQNQQYTRQYLGIRRWNNVSLTVSENQRSWSYGADGNGLYTVETYWYWEQTYSVQYVDNAFELTDGDPSTNRVYLYKYEQLPTVTGYVKIDTPTQYTLKVNEMSVQELENKLKEKLEVWYATADDQSDAYKTTEYEINMGGVNTAEEGTYTVTVTAYGQTQEITVNVTKAVVKELSLRDTSGSVPYAAGSSASTGAIIDVVYDDGTSGEIFVTLDMLSGATIDTGKVEMDGQGVYKNNVYENLTVTYHGKVLSTDFTLTVLAPTAYPEFPNEGSVRFDKTSTAIGNFDETGIVQMELSMTGVPYTTNNELDVVLVLDNSSSMNTNRTAAAKAAAKAFVKSIVINEDGSYNNNRVSVVSFDKSADVEWELEAVTKISDVNTTIDNIGKGSGTNYKGGLSKAQEILQSAKTDGTGNGRQQFCVFMSDGAPYDYYHTVEGDDVTPGESGWVTNGARNSSYKCEYYSTEMKNDGVTVYSVALGVTAAQPLFLLNDISGPAGETKNDSGSERTKQGSYFFSVSDADAAANLSAVFKNIASKILEAAKNIVVRDKIADEYTMIFDVPVGSDKENNEALNSSLSNQEFYIEVKEHTLDEKHERTETVNSLAKVYLGVSNGTYYAATDASGTKWADPVFTKVTADAEGVNPKAYYSIIEDGTKVGKDDIVIEVNGKKYLFMPAGNGTHNITSGAYAYGTINSTTNTSDDLVIITPYFAYSAATRMLAWTIEKLTTTELALSYFLYLENSATQIGTDQMISAGSYPTNEWADVNYTNYTGNTASREFPVPQQTWNGAQVSYVFYLVNKKGEPINKSGQVVDFANASFVTDVFTESVVWKDSGGTGELNIEYLAQKLLPQDYTVYDKEANYTIHVYQKAVDSTVLDYFIIGGSESGLTSTTKVYNTRAGARYDKYGVYSAAEEGTTFSTTNADGETVEITTTQQADDLDYSDTTVAFAVVWEHKLVEDVVVVDYGLDVVVDVVSNDLMQNTVSGIGLGKEAYGEIEMNTAVSEISKLGTTSQTQKGLTISIENANSVRIHQNDMKFDEPVTFYYESPVEFYEGSSKKSGYMYSSITVVPATSIYYEENFVDFGAGWQNAGAASTATQAQDRPGDLQLSASLDANNLYGYDSAYANMTEYSMGSAKKATVSGTKEATASFTFTGTGFDVISLTSSNSGTITVEVTQLDGTPVCGPYLVDTYYGYSYGKATDESQVDSWYVDPHDPDTLYQVPVMKVTGLDHGTYTATITAAYGEVFDHVGDGSYDFYLDAVRIYDPAGNSDAVKGYHTADKEYSPKYKELRDILIGAKSFGTNGSVFIDGYSDLTEIAMYENFGPNNEVYLASDQSVSFELNAASISGGTVESVQIGLSSTGGTAVAEIQGGGVSKTVSVGATDMYYDITEMDQKDVQIKNTGNGVLSVTNIKVTLKAPN